MTTRYNFLATHNRGVSTLAAVDAWIAQSFDPKLLELVRVRVSQMNGCGHCLHLHSQNALKLGESEDRLFLLNALRDSELFTERERAALQWAEVLTRIEATHAPDEAYEEVSAFFDDDELVALSIGIAMINAWNRLAIGFRLPHLADRQQAAA